MNNVRRRIFFALFLAAMLWMLAWVAAKGLIVSDPIERADVIVVLSGSSTMLERARHAAMLYADHRAPKIILTNDNRQGGWSAAEQRNPYFYEIALNELARSGVPRQQIEILDTPVASTWDEAKLLKQYCHVHNLRSILIVTSAYHSRRALWTFRKALGSAAQVGIDSPKPGIETPSPPTWWLYPKGWSLVFAEYIKLIYYFSRPSTEFQAIVWWCGRIRSFTI